MYFTDLKRKIGIRAQSMGHWNDNEYIPHYSSSEKSLVRLRTKFQSVRVHAVKILKIDKL